MAAKPLRLLRSKITGEIRDIPKYWDRRNDPNYSYLFTHFTDSPDWEDVDNFTFRETLTFSYFYSGNSSFSGVFLRENNTKVYVWASQMPEFISKMEFGKITDTFTFKKHGQSIGVVTTSGDALF
jgi:hypothetical protein